MEGPDHSSSLNPQDFEKLVRSIRIVESALGSSNKSVTDKEQKNITGMRRSLVVIKDVKKGEIFTEENLGYKRPFIGLHPKMFNQIIGKKASRDISKDTHLKEEDINNTI